MTTNDTNVQNLIINLLSQEQYENIDSPSSTELYLTPDTSLSEGDLKTINNTSIVGSGNITVQATISGAATTITNNDLTANRALISNGSGKVAASSITSTKLSYLTDVTSNIQAQINNKQATISDLSTIRSGAEAGATAVQPSEISDMATQTWVGNQGYLTEHQDISGKANLSELASVATTGSYNDLDDKPTIPTVPTNVSDFTNDAGYITNSALSGYALTTDIPQSVSELDNDSGYLTEHQSLDGYQKTDTAVTHTKNTAVGNTITPVYINSSGAATALGYTIAKSVPSDANFSNTTYSAGTDLSLSGTTFNHKASGVTAGTVGTSTASSGSTLTVPYVTYNAQGHITATGTRTHTVSGFLTSHQDISGKANISELAEVATSGDYTDLINKPSIPSTYTAGTGLQLNANEFKLLQEDYGVDPTPIIIGTVTEAAGVYSGFSKDNGLKLPSVFEIGASDSYEIQMKINYRGSGQYNIILYANDNGNIYKCNITNYLSDVGIWMNGTSSTPTRYSFSNTNWSLGIYFIKFIRTVGDGNFRTQTMYSTDGENWTNGIDTTTQGVQHPVNLQFYLGGGSGDNNSSTTAYIDINGCYIKKNGEYWWNPSESTYKPCAKATNNLYGLVKPDNTSITVNDGVISGFSGDYEDLTNKPVIPEPYTAGTGLTLSASNEFGIRQSDNIVTSWELYGTGITKVSDYYYTGNFLSTDYLLLPVSFEVKSTDSLEWQFCYTAKSNATANPIITAEPSSTFYYRYHNTNHGFVGLPGVTSGALITNGINSNTTYYIRAKRTVQGSGYLCESWWSLDGETWTQAANTTGNLTSDTTISNIKIGGQSATFNAISAVNLEGFYIKVNDEYIWSPTMIPKYVAKATDSLYGLVKPDGTSITVNNGVISSHNTATYDATNKMLIL